jgi:hypothetical protein
MKHIVEANRVYLETGDEGAAIVAAECMRLGVDSLPVLRHEIRPYNRLLDLLGM